MPPFLRLLPCVLLLAACDNLDEQRLFEADASRAPQGITPMDAGGNPIGPPDPDDWRSAPLFPAVAVGPAYPNPVPAGFGANVTVPVSAPFTGTFQGGVLLFVVNPRETGAFIVRLDDVPSGAFPGTAVLTFSLADLRAGLGLANARGLYRLYVQDGGGRLISYGDLLVE